jgi:hypothetical protein
MQVHPVNANEASLTELQLERVRDLEARRGEAVVWAIPAGSVFVATAGGVLEVLEPAPSHLLVYDAGGPIWKEGERDAA